MEELVVNASGSWYWSYISFEIISWIRAEKCCLFTVLAFECFSWVYYSPNCFKVRFTRGCGFSNFLRPFYIQQDKALVFRSDIYDWIYLLSCWMVMHLPSWDPWRTICEKPTKDNVAFGLPIDYKYPVVVYVGLASFEPQCHNLVKFNEEFIPFFA